MTITSPTKQTIYEDSAATCMARMVGENAANIAQADLSTITYRLYNTDTGAATATAATTVTIATSVFDTLQTDSRWTVDSTGYNFRHQIPATRFTDPNITYRAEYKFTPTSGQPYWATYDITTVGIYTS